MNTCIQTLVYSVMLVLLCAFAAACSTIKPLPNNMPVRLIFYNELNLVTPKTRECKYLGPIIGSAGHWYNYLFISNEDLTLGAINDIYNKSNSIGANIVYINNNIDFTTSVTLLGQAYNCTDENSSRSRKI